LPLSWKKAEANLELFCCEEIFFTVSCSLILYFKLKHGKIKLEEKQSLQSQIILYFIKIINKYLTEKLTKHLIEENSFEKID